MEHSTPLKAVHHSGSCDVPRRATAIRQRCSSCPMLARATWLLMLALDPSECAPVIVIPVEPFGTEGIWRDGTKPVVDETRRMALVTADMACRIDKAQR